MSDEPEQEKSGQEDAEREQAAQAESLAQAAGPVAHPKRRGRILLWLGVMVVVLLLAAVGVLRYVAGAEFHERARQFAIEQLEQASGGRVELAGVEWNLRRLEFELNGLQVHGTEAADEAPLLRVERVRGRRVKLAALLRGRIVLRELQVLHPLAHVDVYKDGSTNLPGLRARHKVPADGSEELLRLAMDRAEMVDGRLDWNEQKIRLDGVASGVFLELGYRAADNHYEGTARVDQVQMRLPGWEPVTLGAEAEFRLFHNEVQVRRLRVSQGHSWVEASGAISGLSSPVAQFSYRAVGDAGELARLIRYRELEGGTVQLNGEGVYRWDRGEYAVVGKAQAVGVTWADSTVRLEKINGGFAYSLDRDHFDVSSMFATALGGTIHGKLDAEHVRGVPASGRIELEVNGAQLEQTLRAFSTSKLPLARLPLAGSMNGPLKVNWRGSLLNARMDGELRVLPLQRAGELPVTGVVQATVDFKGAAVEIHNLDVSTGVTHLSARGRLAASSELKLDVASEELSELAPMVASWRGSRAQELPIEFGGRAEFRGSVQGRLDRPALAGHLELHDFTTLLRRGETLAGDAAPKEHVVRTRWELLAGDVEYSPSRESLHNGVLRRGSARIGLDASVGLVDGSYDATQPISAHVRVENADAGDLQALVGSSYPVTGRVSGDVQLSGTSSNLSGSGQIAMSDGSAWRQSVRSARARVNFTENQAQLRDIVVKSDAMQLSGNARINVQSREFGFDLKGTELKLENLRVVREGKVRVSGQATFDVSGSGTPDAPVINGRLRLRNLAVNRQAIGDMNVDAVTHGAEMTVTARSNFKNAGVNLDGQIHLRDQMPMHLSGDVQSANLNPLLEAYLPLRNGAASELKAHVEASGEARHPRAITAELVVEHWATNYAGINVSNDGPIRMRMANEVLRIEQF